MLRAVVLAILCCVHAASGVTHSWKAFYTGTLGADEFPEFVAVNMVDDFEIGYFDSKTSQFYSKQKWMEDNLGQEYWDRQTNILKGHQQSFKANVGIAMQRFNQTGGVHTWQEMYGCELDDDETKRGFKQFGYDGDDYISFDKDTLTWTAASQRGFTTKVRWDPNTAYNQYWKGYLEETCIEWLRKYVQYGRKTLERRVPPAVTLLQRKARGSADTEVLCHVTGFFPRAVEVTWVRDGQDQLEQRVQSGEVLPNQDGTFQLRKILTVSPEEQGRHSYSCQVDHISLDQKIVKEWDPNMRSSSDGSPPIGLIAGVIVGVLALAAVIIGVVVWKKRQGGAQKSDYSKAPSKEGSDTSSDTAANA